MRRSILRGAGLLVLLSGSLGAQESHRRQGFWLGFGLGPGVNLSEGLDGEKLWGGNGYLRLGGTPRRNLLLGGEAIGSAVDYRDVTLSRGNVHFVALLYPDVRSGF
jgi:hypothetical protein